MDWRDLLIEQQIAEAIERGEMATPNLAGRALPDIDRQRPDGWWAERYVAEAKASIEREPEPGEDMIAAFRRRPTRRPS